jgi:hypothetical protein
VREEEISYYHDTRKAIIEPDLKLDVTNLPFEDGRFRLVVFDPPHFLHAGNASYMKAKYGILPEDWQTFLKKGFAECWRVLNSEFGIVIFKWNEYQIPIKKVLANIPQKPLLGERRGKGNKTHWLIFVKGGDCGQPR